MINIIFLQCILFYIFAFMTNKQKIMIDFFRNRINENPVMIKSDEAKATIEEIIKDNLTVNENFSIEIDGYFSYKKFKTVLRYLIFMAYPFYIINLKGKIQELIYNDYKKWSNNELPLNEFQEKIKNCKNEILKNEQKRITKRNS